MILDYETCFADVCHEDFGRAKEFYDCFISKAACCDDRFFAYRLNHNIVQNQDGWKHVIAERWRQLFHC